MNRPPLEDEFDLENTPRQPYARVELVYEPSLHPNFTAANASPGSNATHNPAPDRSVASVTRRPKPRRAIVRRRKAAVAALPPASVERHERKCVICAHPDREAIDELFLHWHSPRIIGIQFNIPVRYIFRHAHATGIYSIRQGNLRAVLDRILERADQATITGESIIRAVRAYVCLTGDNNWVEPPSRVVFSSGLSSLADTR